MLIRKLAADHYQLITPEQVAEGSLAALKVLAAGEAVILVLPATLCTIRQLTFADHERKLLDKVLPFSLEEDLAERVDELHFVIGMSTDQAASATNTALVAYVNKQLLSDELQDFNTHQIALQGCLPESCLLPWSPGQWSLVFPGSGLQCMIRTNEGESISSSGDNLPLVLKILTREKTFPEKVMVYLSPSEDPSVEQQVRLILSELKLEKVEFIYQEYAQLLLQQSPSILARKKKKSSGGVLDLLTGEFSPQLPWGHWWKQWQLAVLLVLAIGVMDLGVRLVEINRLRNLNQQLANETEELFRQVVPEGALVDPRLQLQRRLESVQGNSGSGFIALLDRAAPVIMNNPELEIQNLNYSDRDREIQMTLITSDFNSAESIRARLQSLGLQAELIGSTSSAEGNRSRLRIGS